MNTLRGSALIWLSGAAAWSLCSCAPDGEPAGDDRTFPDHATEGGVIEPAIPEAARKPAGSLAFAGELGCGGWTPDVTGTCKLVWARVHDDPGVGRGIAVDPLGKIAVTGSVYLPWAPAPESLVEHLYVARYTPGGAALWSIVESAGDPSSIRRGQRIASDGSGNLYVAMITGWGYIHTTATLRKYAADGALLWTAQRSGTANTTPTGVAAIPGVPSGDVVWTGLSSSLFRWTERLTSDGTSQWSIGGQGELLAGTADAAGRTIVGGWEEVWQTEPPWDVIYPAFVTAYDAAGALLWRHDEVGEGFGPTVGVAVDATGHVIATGMGGWLRKLDPSGNPVWTVTIPDVDPEQVAVSPDGEVLLIGEQAGDIAIRRYDPDGVELCSTTVDGGGQDHAGGVASSANGHMFVVGSVHDGESSNIWFARFAR